MAGHLHWANVLDLELAAARGGWPVDLPLGILLLRSEAWHHLWAEFANALRRLLLILLLTRQRWQVTSSLDGEVDHHFLRRGVEIIVRVYLG